MRYVGEMSLVCREQLYAVLAKRRWFLEFDSYAVLAEHPRACKRWLLGRATNLCRFVVAIIAVLAGRPYFRDS